MYPGEDITNERACGRRAAGGVYAETRLGEEGLPLEHFMLCPPTPVDLAQWGLAAVGVQLIAFQGVWHVFDVVGQAFYPHVADFVEETRRKGASRRLPRTLNFGKLTADSRLVLIHARTVIENFVEYPQPPVLACPKDLHLVDLREPCTGLWWHDIPESDLEHWAGGSLYYRTLPGGVSYTAYPRDPDCMPAYQHGIFMSLSITNLAVIAGRYPREEREAADAFQAACKSGLPVFVEKE